MDAVVAEQREEAAYAPLRVDNGLPPEQPLPMPPQSFTRWGKSERRPYVARASARRPWVTRLLVFGGAIAITLYGVREMVAVVSVGATTFLQYVLVAFFTLRTRPETPNPQLLPDRPAGGTAADDEVVTR